MLLPVNGSLATLHHAVLEFLKKLGLCSYEIVRKNSQFFEVKLQIIKITRATNNPKAMLNYQADQ